MIKMKEWIWSISDNPFIFFFTIKIRWRADERMKQGYKKKKKSTSIWLIDYWTRAITQDVLWHFFFSSSFSFIYFFFLFKLQSGTRSTLKLGLQLITLTFEYLYRFSFRPRTVYWYLIKFFQIRFQNIISYTWIKN